MKIQQSVLYDWKPTPCHRFSSFSHNDSNCHLNPSKLVISKDHSHSKKAHRPLPPKPLTPSVTKAITTTHIVATSSALLILIKLRYSLLYRKSLGMPPYLIKTTIWLMSLHADDLPSMTTGITIRLTTSPLFMHRMCIIRRTCLKLL